MIQVPVTFDSANRKKDKSVSIRFTTNFEISNRDFAEMDLNVGTEGWLLFKGNEFSPDDIPEDDAPAEEGKSWVQRLRGVKYLQWLKTDQSEPFDIKWGRYKVALLEKEKERLD